MLSATPEADGIVGDLGGGSLELIDVRGGKLRDGITLPRPRARGTAPSLPSAEVSKRRSRKSTPPSETLFAGPALVEDEPAAAE